MGRDHDCLQVGFAADQGDVKRVGRDVVGRVRDARNVFQAGMAMCVSKPQFRNEHIRHEGDQRR